MDRDSAECQLRNNKREYQFVETTSSTKIVYVAKLPLRIIFNVAALLLHAMKTTKGLVGSGGTYRRKNKRIS